MGQISGQFYSPSSIYPLILFSFFFTPRLGGYFFINPICMGMWSRKIPGKKHESCHCSTMLLYCTLVPTGQAGSGLTKPYPGALIFLAGHVGFPSNFWTELNENKRKKPLWNTETRNLCACPWGSASHIWLINVEQCWTYHDYSKPPVRK